MSAKNKSKTLAKYIGTLVDFEYVEPEIPYNHMGATIVDAMLQAGLRYETVVKPRVNKIRNEYPGAKTSSGFLKIIENTDLKKIINWKDSEKPNRILEVTKFFAKEGIETEPQLKSWLEKEQNISKLAEVRGIGNKTLDYIRFLSGISTTAIDRHLLNFLKRASIEVRGYNEAKDVVNDAAELLNKDQSLLDHSIWKYMSENKTRAKSCEGKKVVRERQANGTIQFKNPNCSIFR